MTTENIQTETTEQVTEQTQERQYTAVEQKAIEQGWRPKEEFSGDPDAFIDAPEFVRRGELFSKIEHQSKELKQVRAALDALKEHNTKIRETEYNRAMKALQSARKQALVNGETDQFLALEERIEEVKEEKAQLDADLKATETSAPQPHPEFVAWAERNSWYETNEAMRAYADRLGTKLHGEGYSPSEVLKRVETKVKEEFAHKFTNPKTSRPMAVEPSSRNSGRSDSFQLDDTEREIMRKLVRAGAMTEKEYIAQLKEVKGIK